jgi:hypothetical protein
MKMDAAYHVPPWLGPGLHRLIYALFIFVYR